MDIGKLTVEEMRQELHKNYPDRTDIIDLVVDTDLRHLLPLRQDIIRYIEELKAKGYEIYGFSNCSQHVINSFNAQYQGFEDLFDGTTFSYRVGTIKPALKDPDCDKIDTTIYDTFFRDNHIKPSTALFIDDSENNVRMGQMLGMPGVQYTKDDTVETIKEKVSGAIEKSKLSDKEDIR